MSDLASAIRWLALALVVYGFITEFGPCEGGDCVEPYATIGHVGTTAVFLGFIVLAIAAGVIHLLRMRKPVRPEEAVQPSAE